MSSSRCLIAAAFALSGAQALQFSARGSFATRGAALRNAASDDAAPAATIEASVPDAVAAGELEAALDAAVVRPEVAAPAVAAPAAAPAAAPVAAPVAAPAAAPRFGASDEWYAKALPWEARPALLAGDLAGDSGFDPAGFVGTKVDLYNYREAEIKHARLAMLAAVGWPLAELWDGPLASLLGLPSLIDANGGRDPSALNGGLGLISPAYWVAVVAFAGAVEFVSENKKAASKKADKAWMVNNKFLPGDLGFDPLGLYVAFGDDAEGSRKWMETAEIKNGRLAMTAVLVYVIEEFVSGKAVVANTPLFFTPFYKVVEQWMLGAPPLYTQ